jgi:hypothetical protein
MVVIEKEKADAQEVINNIKHSYTPEIALTVLRTYGISVGPQETLSADETGKIDIYIYPLAQVFPVQSFLEDTIQYLLLRKNQARDRRLGLFLQEDNGRWFMLLLNMGDFQEAFAKDLREELNSKGFYSSKDVKAILADPFLAEKCRHLYAKVEPMILGAQLEKPVLDKLGKLLTTAYGIEMNLATLPVEHPDYREVHLVQDALTLLKSGKVIRAIPTLDIFYAHQKVCQQAYRVYEDQAQQYQKVMRAFAEYGHSFDAKRQ